MTTRQKNIKNGFNLVVSDLQTRQLTDNKLPNTKTSILTASQQQYALAKRLK
jgi:hypothetical protein